MSLATSFNIQIYWETFEVLFEAEKRTKVAFFTLIFSSSTRFIPELPADSCKEIKASEGEVVSGYYWLQLERLRDVVQVFCDMQTEGIHLRTFKNVELS